MGPILMVFLASLVISGVLALPILKLLVALKSRQTVSQHLPEHAAKQGTPTMGGIIIAVGFLAGMVAALLGTAVNSGAKNYLWGFIAVFLAFALIGFVDDYLVPRLLAGKRGLGWTQKLVLQLLATLVFFPVSGITIGLPEAAAGVVVILFFSNAYNFSDGMDALAGSLLVVISTGFAFISYQQGHGELLIPVAAFLGGAIPFLWLNRPPARVFMGDVGSLPIGAVLGLIVCTLSFSGWQPNWVNLAPGEAVPFT